MNYREIVEVLKNNLNNVKIFAYQDYSSSELGLGRVEEIDDASEGGEGEGEHWVRVFHFVDHDVYIRITAHYQSYEGVDFYEGWDSLDEVKPKEVLKIVYQAI